MQKIIPHLWFDKEAKEAAAFYVSLFKDSKIDSTRTISDTPSGDSDMVAFSLLGQDFMAISAGPFFKLNPSISLFVTCETEEEIDALWKALAEGGKVLMGYDAYPWAKKYGWLQDKYGVSWQMSFNGPEKVEQRITPFLMFTKEAAGNAKEAMEYYMTVFPDSHIDMIVPYEKQDSDKEGFTKQARFTLAGQSFAAMDSSGPHEFGFNEALSFVVNCDTQEEIDHYWKMSAVPASEQCGWLKDRYGVSWQIVPRVMREMMKTGTNEQVDRITQAFLKMKKFDLAALEEAFKE